MDGLRLLQEAYSAGLAVAAESGRLVIRGPKRAEPVALRLIGHKPEVLAALDEVAEWQARQREALAHWRVFHGRNEAQRLAWGELEDRWHRLCGERVARHLCAGCQQPIGSRATLDMNTGERAHLDRLDCLIRFGERWRGAATSALVLMGLTPPDGAQAR
jgi:hypothetical protein